MKHRWLHGSALLLLCLVALLVASSRPAHAITFSSGNLQPGVSRSVIESTIVGNMERTGTAPTVGTGASDCGTAPAVAGNNTTGVVTLGSSTNGGVCTLTFAGIWRNIPHCFCNNRTSAARPCAAVGTTNTTNATTALTATATFTAGDVIEYFCIGHF